MTESTPTPPARFAAGWVFALALAALFLGACWIELPKGFIGFTRDDTIYALGARAIAAGKGYVDLSDPKLPGMMRFPPGMSLLLAAAMRLGDQDLYAQMLRAQLVPPIAGFLVVLLTYAYLRRAGDLRPSIAVAACAWCAAQPATLLVAIRVMADVPSAALGLATVLCFDAAILGGAGLGAWAGIGVLLGLGLLLRYAAVSLVFAAGLILLRDRLWRPLAATVVGCLAVLLPWFAYRAVIGGNDYAHSVNVFMPHGLDGWLRACSLVSANFFGDAAPSLVFGGLFASYLITPVTPLMLITGLLVTLAVVAGAFLGLTRPRPGRSGVGDAYFLITMVMVVAWCVPFAWYGGVLMQRLLVPVAPFAVVALLRAVEAGFARFGPRRVVAAQAGVAALGLLFCVHGFLISLFMYSTPPSFIRSYNELFDQIRHKTPANAIMMSQDGRIITLYTDRPCFTVPAFAAKPGDLPREPNSPQFVLYLHQHQVRYLVGTPHVEVNEGHDRSIVSLNHLIEDAPGLLKDVYKSRAGNFAIFEVDPAVLADLDAQVRAAK